MSNINAASIAYRDAQGNLCTVRSLTESDVEKLSADHTAIGQLQTTVTEQGEILADLQETVEEHGTALESKLATDMSNIDSAGEAKIKEVASDMAVVSRTVAGATQDTILAIDEADITDLLPKASTAQYGLYKVPEVVVTDLVPLINESTSTVKIASGKLFMTRCGNLVSISAQNLHIEDETVNTNYFTFYRLPSPACGVEQHAIGFRNLKTTGDFFWVDTARGHTLSIRVGSTLSGQGMYGTVTYITNEA